MTKRERARVVELLRCAADLKQRRSEFPIIDAIDDENGDYDTADNRIADIAYKSIAGTDEGFTALLEAAARVELGEWP